MNMIVQPCRVRFPEGYDERREAETPDKGYLGGVVVELDDGRRYQLFFFDPVRLRQELDMNCRDGQPYVAEPNMVVLPEVSTASITEAAHRLLADGYFDHLKPLAPGA